MRKTILAIIFIVLIVALIFVAMGKYPGGKPAGDKQGSKDKKVAVSKAPPSKDNTIFAWQFETWQPDNLHWDAPSSLNISDDGDWYAFASRLENQRRSGGFFDTGHNYSYDITVNFYPVFNSAAQSCEGAALYGFAIHVDSLDYKQVHTNVTVRGKDRKIQEIVARANCAIASREIH